MLQIEHRGYTATAIRDGMYIKDWNGKVVAKDPHWPGRTGGPGQEAKLRKAVDDFIRLAPYVGASWWREA